MAQWKAAEKEVAAFFNGTRRVRVSYSDKIGDIIHPTLSIEVKYGKQIPKYLMPDKPTQLVTPGGRYVVFHSETFRALGGSGVDPRPKIFKSTLGKFLEDAMSQARRYNPTLVPVVCVKGRSKRGFWIVLESRWTE